MQLRRRLPRNDDGSGCRQVGCGRWGWCDSQAQKCAPARHGGLKAGPTNPVNRTAAAVASLGHAGQESGDHLRQNLHLRRPPPPDTRRRRLPSDTRREGPTRCTKMCHLVGGGDGDRGARGQALTCTPRAEDGKLSSSGAVPLVGGSCFVAGAGRGRRFSAFWPRARV